MAVFATEAVIMLLLSIFPITNDIFRVLTDSSLLVLILSPVLYRFLYRPLRKELQFRADTLKELEEAGIVKITEEKRKATEEALRGASETLGTLVAASPLAIVTLDLRGNVLMWNPAAEKIFGWSEEEVTGKFLPFVPEDKIEEYQLFHARVAKGERFSGVEVTRRKKDGNAVEIRIATAPLRAANGEVSGVLGICEDITEGKKMEEEIYQAKKEWEEVFNTITDMITVHDTDYNIIRSNKAAEHMLKLPFLQNAMAKCYEYYHGTGCPPEGCPSCQCLKTGRPATSEIFEPHLNMFIEIRAIPRFDSKGNLIGLIHVVRDISEKKKHEEKIKKQLEYITALRTIDITITSSLDLRITLNVLLEQVLAQIPVDAASILLLNPHTLFLEHAASKGFKTSSTIKNTSLRIGNGYAGRAAAQRETVVVRDTSVNKFDGEWHKMLEKEEFASYVGIPLIVKGHVKGVLEVFLRSPLKAESEWIDFLDALAGQAAIAIDNAAMFNDLRRSHNELIMAYETTIEGWSRALDYRDRETEGHSRRVTDITLRIAREIGVPDEDLPHIRRGALLHDIGKIGIPDAILFKTGRLTAEEWEVMQRHPTIAYEILSPISFLRPALDIPYCHHEKWDGTGYPRGLKEEQIPIAARIFAIVDFWDALCSDRPYRQAWQKDKVREHVFFLSGIHFDPNVVEISLKNLENS
ncbi:MAG: PAS domain S-box protein [Candidatus Sulfobium sp.]